MATASSHFEIPTTITRKVSWLRLLVRSYVLLEGLAAVVIVLGVAFWLGLALDWLFEPDSWVRVVMWCAACAAACFVAWKWLLARLLARISDASLALLLERSFPQIDQSLVTTLQAG